MKKVYEEPRLEILKFNIEEYIMNDGNFPSVDAGSNNDGWGEESTEEWM